MNAGFVENFVRTNTTHAKAEAPGTGPSIMIIDDNQATTHALAGLLKHAGYQPVTFATGHDALAHAQAHPSAAAAIVDVHLPDLSGLVLSRLLRNHLGPDVPIIVLSGDGSMEVLNSLSHVGATHFFQKPVSIETLLGHLREIGV